MVRALLTNGHAGGASLVQRESSRLARPSHTLMPATSGPGTRNTPGIAPAVGPSVAALRFREAQPSVSTRPPETPLETTLGRLRRWLTRACSRPCKRSSRVLTGRTRPLRTTSRSGGADDGFATNGAVCEHLRRRSRRCWYWTASDSERFRGSAPSRRSRSSDSVIAAALCSTPECAAQLPHGRHPRVARESRLNPPAAIRARDQGATLASLQGDILQGAPTKQTPVGRQRSRVEGAAALPRHIPAHARSACRGRAVVALHRTQTPANAGKVTTAGSARARWTAHGPARG
jgi:hypothetical protein